MELFLFTTDPHFAAQAQAAGIDGIIVDWETKGKDSRQLGFNLETNADTPDDVRLLAGRLSLPVIVRVNPYGSDTAGEVETALAAGARMLMLPMAFSAENVAGFLALVNERVQTIIQIETPQLADQARELTALNWDYAYIGLNDLMVAQGRRNIWEAVIDGTVDRICSALAGRKFGFGGATVIGGGEPLPGTLIMHELVRLGASVTFLRRTLKKELLDRDLAAEIAALRSFIAASEQRGELARYHDRKLLHAAIRKLVGRRTLAANRAARADRYPMPV